MFQVVLGQLNRAKEMNVEKANAFAGLKYWDYVILQLTSQVQSLKEL